MDPDSALSAAKRGRARSWVGVEEGKPHAYLREAMVSKLMSRICDPDAVVEGWEPRPLHLPSRRRSLVAAAIGTWDFSAHDLSDDELLQAAWLMLQHALTMSDLDRWRISSHDLMAFVQATRVAYNAFVPYHNFRHVVDVLQAVFYFLLQLDLLPHHPSYVPSPSAVDPSVARGLGSVLRPFEVLTVLITAIGHDVGHPGVNNAFLVNLKAPLAQLYNDRSVLESFHCAAFSQILRRYWPASFEATEMRKLLITTILATDMGLHFDYMKKLAQLQTAASDEPTVVGGGVIDSMALDERRTLLCSLLIKCADISNVARNHEVASRWACILTDEFARQATMEAELGIPSALFAPPVRDSIVELGKSQIGFMNLFALPLFRGVSDVLPTMHFTVDQILSNRNVWEAKIEREMDAFGRQGGGTGSGDGGGGLQAPPDGSISLRSHSISSLSQSPEHHPPAMLNHPSMDVHLVSSTRASWTNGFDLSPRSSLGTLPHLAGSLPASIRHSAQGSSPTAVLAVGELSSGVERSSRTPSTAYASPPSPRPQPSPRPRRRSSNTVPGQLPLGLTGATGATTTSTTTRPSTDHRPTDADPSVVAVVVTSPKGATKSTLSGPMSPSSSPPPPPPPPQQQQPSSRQAKRHSSEKGSVPSSNEWQSQTTSPTNVTYSPTTEATSFLSETSSERRGVGHRGMNGCSSKSPSVTTSQLEFDNDHFYHSSHHTNDLLYQQQRQQHHHHRHHMGLSLATSNESRDIYGITDEVATPPPSLPLSASDSTMNKTIRHRPSRWRLNFWKNRRKEHSNSSGSSP